MKRHLILSLVATLLALPMLAQDFSYTYAGQTLTYTVLSATDRTVQTKAGGTYTNSAGNTEFNAGNNVSGDLEIPSTVTYNGRSYSVISVGEYGFHANDGLTSVFIPNSVRTLGYRSFESCNSLQSVRLSESLTSTGECVFSGCLSLTSISIPNSVTQIGYYSFTRSGLTSVTIPSPVTYIDENAFCNCRSLTTINVDSNNQKFSSVDGVLFNKEHTTLVIYPCGKTATTYSIPNSVTEIGFCSFIYSKLNSVEIPNSVSVIGPYAFNYCSNLASITSKAMTPPTCYDDITTNYDIELYVPEKSFAAYSQAEIWRQFQNISGISGTNPDDDMDDVTFPDWQSTNHTDDSTSEKVYTFSAAAGNVLTFNYAVDSEETYDKLIVKLNDETVLTKSGNQSGHFSKKFTAATDVTLTLMYTKDGSVSGGEDCAWVTDIILHKQPFEEQPFVGKEFEYTYEGQTITYVITDVDAKTCKTKDGDWDHPGNTVSGNLILPSTAYDGNNSYTLTEIGRYAFENCYGLTSITIPTSVTYIDEFALYNCFGLTSIVIPNSVNYFGNYSFYKCTGLTSLTISSSAYNLGDYAFSHCSGLTDVNIPNSITYIGSGSFANCTNLTAINVAPENSYYTAQNGILYSKDLSELIQYPAGKNQRTFEIPNSVSRVYDYAFSGCNNLTSVTLPNSITNLGDGAFEYCSGLTSISIPNSVTVIGYNTFAFCYGLNSVTIPNSVFYIDPSAFEYCRGLTSVAIGNSVTQIGNFAFNGCTGLQSIEILAVTPPSCGGINTFDSEIFSQAILKVPANSIDDYKSSAIWEEFSNIVGFNDEQMPFEATIDGLHYILNPTDHCATITYSEQNSLSNYEGKLSIIIPESVESGSEIYTVVGIGDEAFNNCWGLKAVSLPETLQTIGKLAFGYCTSLRSVAIPDNVTVIDDEAFTGCSALASVTIGNSVEAIGDYAFFGCTGLASLRVPESVKTIGENAFMGIHWLNEVRAESPTPAETPVSAFSNNAYKNATLVVPNGTIESYKAHPAWSNFMTIREVSDISSIIEVIDDAIVVKGSEYVKIYNTSGAQVYVGPAGRVELPSGIYLIVTDSVSKKVRI